MTGREDGNRTPSAQLRRLRLALAAVVVVACLLAASAWFKNVTCGCGSSGLPWETIALIATGVAAVSIAVYVAVGVISRRR